MVLSAKKLSETIRVGNSCNPAGISLIPCPNLDKVDASGEASVTLRLGRWFLTLKQSGSTHISINPEVPTKENKVGRKYYVPFGETFILHPNRFVLASTLEWLRLPATNAAVVVGKSTLGRRGIIIETAAGVHPGFSGCLTLEIANVGEMPVELIAGMPICQIFVHSVEGPTGQSKTSLAGQRKPRLGSVKKNLVLERLTATKT